MDSPVEVRFSLSPDLLDRLLLLTQQVQGLLSDSHGVDSAPGEAVNSAFDPLRFQALAETETPGASTSVFSALDAPITASADVSDGLTVAHFFTKTTPEPKVMEYDPSPAVSVHSLSTVLRRDCRRYDSGFSML